MNILHFPSCPGPQALGSHLDRAPLPVEVVAIRLFAPPGAPVRALGDWLAGALQAYVGGSAICYRVSDDAFALVIDDAPLHEGTRVARELAEALDGSDDWRASQLVVRMAVSRAEAGGRNGREALAHAAEKLQRASDVDPVRVTPARGVALPAASHHMELLPIGEMLW